MKLDHNSPISIGLVIFLLGLAFSAGKLHTDMSHIQQSLRDLKTDVSNLNQVRSRRIAGPGEVGAP